MKLLVLLAFAAAALAAAAVLAGNGHATPAACNELQMEQTGPKYLPCTGSSTKPTITATRGGIQITITTLCEDELGPKYLLSHC